jgi:Flp pilus assembly protein TadG
MAKAITAMLRSALRCTRGASAIETAILAPLLCGFLAVMVDVGMSVGARMELDRNVRAGAQAAMSLNNTAAGVAAIVHASAGGRQDLDVRVERSCVCGVATAACSVVCASSEPPSVIYAIEAARPVAGMVLGERRVTSATRIQLR